MKTKTAAIPNNYSLFRANYSDICRITRQLLVFSYELLGFQVKLLANYSRLRVNYSFLPSTTHFLQLSRIVSNYPRTIRN